MKTIHFFLFALLITPLQAQPESTKAESGIESVTVFFNEAEVTRTAKQTISKGTSELKFDGLSEHIKPASIQVSARGNFTILGVNHRINYLDEQKEDEQIRALRARVDEINEEIEDNSTIHSVYQKEEQLLEENRKLGGKEQGVSADEIRQAADFYRERLTEIKEAQLLLVRANKELQEERQKVQNQLSNLTDQDENPTSEILVTVDADATVPDATFEISYVVSNANWYPTYDIRGQELGDPLAITWKANVSQNTGVDWKDVNLTVSTGDPTLGGVKPELGRWFLDMRNGVPYGFKQGGRKGTIRQVSGTVRDAQNRQLLPYVSVKVKGSSIGTTTNNSGQYELTLPENAERLVFSYVGYQTVEYPVNSAVINVSMRPGVQQMEEVRIMDDADSKNRQSMSSKFEGELAGAVAAPPAASAPEVAQQTQTTTREFAIQSKYDIPSGGSPTTVEINQTDVPARYVYYTVPKEEPAAFLVADIMGWDTLNLIGGEANLYFEGTYVGKTVIDPSNTDDTLSLSLGRDQSVLVSREKQRDFTKKQFLGGNKIQSIGWKTTVRNKKDKPIRIEVQDQIPVSKTKEIEVELEAKGGADLNKTTGQLEWLLEVPAGSSKQAEFKYTVKYPKGGDISLE